MIPIIHYPVHSVVAYQQQDCNKVSFKGTLKMLEPQKIWSNFDDISKIYRESGHCQEISEYLKKRLLKSGFEVLQKEDGTICASRNVNKTKNNAVILQAHMDMVAISEDKNPRKPIEMNIKDGWLYANNRTLGADNGIGVSTILAVAEDSRFSKYPLEMIITTDEETSMLGAQKLKSQDFYGKYLINLDSEKLGVITKGCAGIASFHVNEKIPMQTMNSSDFQKITIQIAGAKGGHSAEIKPDSFNPIQALIRELINKDVKISSISGGERQNAIPREATAEILVPKVGSAQFESGLMYELKNIILPNKRNNPELVCSVSSQSAPFNSTYIEPEFQKKMLASLNSVPTGLMSKFEDNGSTKTSQNFGVLNVKDGEFQAQIMGRSSDIKEGEDLENKTSKVLSNLFGKEISVSDTDPIWQPKNNTMLESIAVKAYSEVSDGSTPLIQVEHGGLEPATFAQIKPDIEQISIGPTIESPHSVKERVKTDTVLPFYNWLSRILDMLSNK